MSDKKDLDRIADALERIADALEALGPIVAQDIEDGGGNGDPPPGG